MASDKLREQSRGDDGGAEMDMSPMIDMVFLLLIFFIVVSSPMIVKMDPAITPAVAYNANKPVEKNGRIVLNVKEDGTYSQEDFNKTMTTPEEIERYVTESIIKIKDEGKGRYKARLHLRGDDQALFKHSQKAIKAAAAAGVDKVIFSVYDFQK